MDAQQHWDRVYSTKTPQQTSWFRSHLDTSLSLIERTTPDRAAAIIDVGGGESTLVDDLLARGYQSVTVLDISSAALQRAKTRLGIAARQVDWIAADVTAASLPPQAYDVWHDRAVFHFLTSPEQRLAYVRQVLHSVKSGGAVIVAAFGPEGPTKCSGLDVVRYDADTLHSEFGERFRLVEQTEELHRTPSGTMQQFLYCYCVRE
jgi:2-polyprenyl-3-methyl-5-hydroxy-6-metoxy-1,4-benzoquinol methylase